MKQLLVAIALILTVPVVGNAGDRTYSVRATVASSTGPIRAIRRPADFKVPAGKTAVHTRCHRHDPKGNWTSKRLCSVYSLTAKRHMKDDKGNPITQLPPGKYRFAVGGYPGAYGTYTYKLLP